ncbi:MAG: hypothetical protein H7287_12865 [Thermoleophilia bacterium]|nr:hypothetical protein [Thermoleophilia bacterium]
MGTIASVMMTRNLSTAQREITTAFRAMQHPRWAQTAAAERAIGKATTALDKLPAFPRHTVSTSPMLAGQLRDIRHILARAGEETAGARWFNPTVARDHANRALDLLETAHDAIYKMAPKAPAGVARAFGL